jgi:hypothetical protein
MYRTVAVCLVLLVHSLFGFESAVGVTLDFESVPGVTPDPDYSNGGLVPASARLNTQLLPTSGVRFRTESPNPDYVALIHLGLGHGTSGLRGIGSVNVANQKAYSLPMLISFFDPTETSTMAVTDFVSIRGDNSEGFGTLTMQAYNPQGVLLGTVSAIDSGGTTLSLTIPNIHRIRLTETISNVAWDDLTFNPLVPVPEPSSVILLALGSLALILINRSRHVA